MGSELLYLDQTTNYFTFALWKVNQSGKSYGGFEGLEGLMKSDANEDSKPKWASCNPLQTTDGSFCLS